MFFQSIHTCCKLDFLGLTLCNRGDTDCRYTDKGRILFNATIGAGKSKLARQKNKNGKKRKEKKRKPKKFTFSRNSERHNAGRPTTMTRKDE